MTSVLVENGMKIGCELNGCYDPVVALVERPTLILVKKSASDIVHMTDHNYSGTCPTTASSSTQPQISKAKKLYYSSMLVVSKSTIISRVVDEKLVNRGFKLMTDLLKAGSSISDKWRCRMKRDSESSKGKKGGSTKRSSTGLNVSSTRVSTKRLSSQLAAYGLCIKDVVGDGNCLFRSLSDQMIGNSENHLEYRQQVAQYIAAHPEDFQPFFAEHENFRRSIKALSKPGTFAGNEALVAFARIYRVDVVIHQLNQSPWRIKAEHRGGRNIDQTSKNTNRHDFGNSIRSSNLTPLSKGRNCRSMMTIKASVNPDGATPGIPSRSLSQECLDSKIIYSMSLLNNEGRELHICYHSFPHYSSVRLLGDANGQNPVFIRLCELAERYPAAAVMKRINSNQEGGKLTKLVKLSTVLASPFKADTESESVVIRRAFAAVDI